MWLILFVMVFDHYILSSRKQWQCGWCYFHGRFDHCIFSSQMQRLLEYGWFNSLFHRILLWSWWSADTYGRRRAGGSVKSSKQRYFSVISPLAIKLSLNINEPLLLLEFWERLATFSPRSFFERRSTMCTKTTTEGEYATWAHCSLSNGSKEEQKKNTRIVVIAE